MQEFLTLTSAALGERLRSADLVLIPCASTEQHGPHLPVGTDALICKGLLERVDARLQTSQENLSLVIVPVIRLGCSHEHRHFPGTLTLRRSTFEDVVKDVVSSVACHGAKRVMLVNSHGGNTSLEAVVRDIRWETETVAYLYDVWQGEAFSDLNETMDWHAGKIETSLMLAMYPELVDQEALPSFDATSSQWLDKQLAGHVAWMAEEISSNGVIGEAREASAAYGEDLIARFEDVFTNFIRELVRQDDAKETP